ncbi:MAG TPA: ShlB/FhaC/HecB family hemolysin secretion/activation protein [Gammaproteobacteria bacterium]|nr:ShlB/FhaC/HecB family hemolysin secretion/activation protein [Gammaproteobacteria bacterium]
MRSLPKEAATRLALAAICGLLGLASPVHAQEALRDEAGAIQRRQQDLLEQERRAQRLREAEEAARRPALEAPAAPLLEIPPELRDYRFEVKRIALDPSAILSAEELKRVTARYEGREIAFQELAALIGELNALYAQKHMLARAVLPPQKISDGVVTVRLIEARVGAVKLTGNASTAEAYVTRRVKIASGALVDLDALREGLVDFNLRNDLSLRAQLAPGASFGTTDIVLQAVEPPRWEATLGFDNAGTEAVGEERVALNLMARSLTRYRDRIITAGVFTEGSKTGSVLVDVPVWRRGTRLGAGFDASDISIENGPLAAADVTGTASTLTLQATHPLLARPDLRVDGLLAYRAKQSSTEFFDVEIANVTVRSIEANVSLTKFDATGTWYTQHGFTSGIDGIGSDNSFLVYRGEVQRWQRLWGDALLRLSVQGQWADIDLLPPAEQFQLGGRYTVRGFREGLLIGDTGYLTSAELRKPVPAQLFGALAPRFAGRVTGKLFVDHGGAFPFKGAGEDIGAEDYLSAAGFGFDVTPIKGMSAQLAWSFPIGFRDDREDYRFIFLVQLGLPQLWR